MRSEIVVNDGRVLHLGLAPGQLAENIFLVGDPARALRVAKRFDEIEHEVRNREYVTLTGTYAGVPVSVIGTGIGVDNVEIALVEAYTVHAFDLDNGERRADATPLKFIRIGTSGGVQDDIEPGTMAIATHGLGLDNGGMYYDHPAADEAVGRIEQLVESANELRADYVTGITAATPGFYGASGRYIEGLANTVPDIKNKLAALRVDELTVVNMEMESSLLFHMAGFMGCPVGTICPVISKPTASTAILDYAASVESAISIALGAMHRLTGASIPGPN
jgi:uridine phosphorylase